MKPYRDADHYDRHTDAQAEARLADLDTYPAVLPEDLEPSHMGADHAPGAQEVDPVRAATSARPAEHTPPGGTGVTFFDHGSNRGQ